MVFDLKFDIFVVSDAPSDSVEDIEVGCNCQVTVQYNIEHLCRKVRIKSLLNRQVVIDIMLYVLDVLFEKNFHTFMLGAPK